MALSKERIEAGKTGLGGSEIASACGLSKWKSAGQLWEEKMGLVEPPEVTPAMERGNFLEDGIVRWTAHRTGLNMTTSRDQKGNQPVQFSDRHELCFATPDGTVWTPEKPHVSIATVEVKSPGLGTSADWSDPDEMPDGIPLYVLPQVMWQMEAAQLRKHEAVVAALIGGDIRVYRIGFNDEMVKLLFAKAEEFWTYVMKKEAPPHDHTAQSAEWIKKFYQQTKGDDLVKLTGQEELDMLKLATRFKNTEQSIKELEATKKEMRARMQDFIRDRAGIEGNGWKATWKTDKQGRIGYKKVVEDLQIDQSVLEQFRGKPSRRFLVNLGKE